MNFTKLTCIAATLLIFTVAAFAGPPRTISYQGYVKNGATPVNGTVPMTFSLYSSTRAGSGHVWRETQPDVPVTNGIYSVQIGSATPINAAFDVPYWLGVNIDNTGELPLQPLSSVPYAFKSGCNPGDMVACYTGPLASLGIGECKGGTRTCAADGSAFGSCAGEVIPTPEVRDNKDNDCNGIVDDGLPFCEPASTAACYTGPGGTIWIGVCHPGLMTCNAEGSAYSPCIGEGLPTPELCDNMDNNCDGAVDNGITYPPVGNGTTTCINGTPTLMCTTGYVSCLSSCDTNILSDTQNCGGCGNICPTLPNAQSTCQMGSCTLSSCNAGFANCDGSAANGCETNTTLDANNCGGCGIGCGVGGFCVNSTCLQPLGSVCASNSQCTSGFCVDGYCCNSLCSGACESCNQSGRQGFCDPIPAGQDPNEECTAQSVSSCGFNGYCSGSRSCAYYPSGTTAVSASCLNSTTLTLASTCNGSGSVVTGGSQSCTPYVCSGAACRTSCTIPADCAAGYTCASNICKKSNAAACFTNGECASGSCTDGVCCENACSGTCEKCSQSGRIGFCDPIPAGTDPDNECLGTNTCSGSRACQ